MAATYLSAGVFGPKDSPAVFTTDPITVQLIDVTVIDTGDGDRAATMTLWDGVREVGYN
ncbi:hypothetical protein RvY_15121 [Ramazzottius varieornatus]|uniref:Uncharacterized protein n=1 Tax=Ramazzottius varieornatus TaxID=947166 RepID=A0A1D1VV63_RAMVA|nr:hypothetical protein RvY_15121 [Ramazzottius varieornatus]